MCRTIADFTQDSNYDRRGQMTVLMRQAVLAVPGIYGPAEEEWAAMRLPPQD